VGFGFFFELWVLVFLGLGQNMAKWVRVLSNLAKWVVGFGSQPVTGKGKESEGDNNSEKATVDRRERTEGRNCSG
jgi:hypothetical protein